MAAPLDMAQPARLFPETASTLAGEIDAVFLTLVGLSTLVMLVVFGLILRYAVRYRRRSDIDHAHRLPPRQRHWLEWTWIAAPIAIFLVIFAWAGHLYVRIYTIPDDAWQIHVTARQWMWKIQHPNGVREINELHIPAHRRIRLLLGSEDVIHSFYVPAFRLKRDAVPGSYQELWFEANRPGEYHLFCAEYCGSRHSRMHGRVVVMAPADYAAWLADRDPGATLAAAGGELFRAFGCSGCHSDNSTVRAPRLAGLYGRPVPLRGGGTVIADDAYLRDAILQPRKQVAAGFDPIMPSFAGQIGEDDLLRLIAFIKSLHTQGEPRE